MSTLAHLRGMSPCNATAGTAPEPPVALPRASIRVDERDATCVVYNARNFSPPTPDSELTRERLGDLRNALSAHRTHTFSISNTESSGEGSARPVVDLSQLMDHQSKRLLVGCMSSIIVSDRLPS